MVLKKDNNDYFDISLKWLLGSFLVAAIPFLSRVILYIFGKCSLDYIMNPIDLALFALALNWTNVNEACSMYSYYKDETLSNGAKLIMLLSGVFILSALMSLSLLYDMDYEMMHNGSKPSNNMYIWFVSILATLSLVMNVIYTFKIKLFK